MPQQSEKDNFNLLLNGNFSDGGANWTPNSSEKVEFVDSYCGLQFGAQITQKVKMDKAGDFEFAVRMKTDGGFACRAILEMFPSRETKQLDISGGIPWTRKETTFKAPAGTTEMTVTLFASDGVQGKLGSYIDYVSLVTVSN